MSVNLLSLAQDAIGAAFSERAGQFLGESPTATQAAMTTILPIVLGRIAQKGATRQGASDLISLIDSADLDVDSLGDFAQIFGSGRAAISDLLKAGTTLLVPALFGDKSGALVNALSSASGIRGRSAINLVALVVPLILTLLKRFIGDKGLDASSLASLLVDQGPNLYGVLDSRLIGALGFASRAAYFGGLGGEAAVMAKRMLTGVASGADAAASNGAAPMAPTRSSPMRWLPWLGGAALVALLWHWPSAMQAPAPAQEGAASAPAPMPTIVDSTLPGKMLAGGQPR